MKLLFLTLFISIHSMAYIGGEATELSEFPATVIFKELRCGGAKIGARTFLTAAHCMVPRGPYPIYVPGGTMEMVTAAGPKILVIESVKVHETFLQRVSVTMDANTAVNSPGVVDLAEIVVTEESPDIEIAEIDNEPLEVGDVVTVGGAGCRSIAEEEGIVFRRELMKNAIIFKTAIKLISEVSAENARVLALDEDEESYSLGCPGDSGTPVYRDGKLVGVNSFLLGEVWLNEDGTLKAKSEDASLNFTHLFKLDAADFFSGL